MPPLDNVGWLPWAVNVLNRGSVAPPDVAGGNTKHVGYSLSLDGAWRPTALEDRSHATLVQSRLLDQISEEDLMLFAKEFDRHRAFLLCHHRCPQEKTTIPLVANPWH